MRTLALNSRMWRLGLMAGLLGSTGAVAGFAQTAQNICYAPDGVTEVTCLQSNSNVTTESGAGANTERTAYHRGGRKAAGAATRAGPRFGAGRCAGHV